MEELPTLASTKHPHAGESYQDNTRFLYTSRDGQSCQHHVHGNSVHKSTSSWWLAWKFFDSMPTLTFSRCLLSGSLDHLIGLEEQGRGNGNPQRLRSLQVDDQFEGHRSFYGQVGRFGALEDAVDVVGRPLP